MMWIIWIAVGALIGWQVPQPAFVARWQASAIAWAKQKFASMGQRW